MMQWVILTACLAVTAAQLTSDFKSMLTGVWMLNTTKPGLERRTAFINRGQCSPWRDHACCTAETTRRLHTSGLYGFRYDHCPGRTMSDKCRRHFVQDLCFYECSPNIGPWVAKIDMKIRNERFYKVPLCASDCIDWYEDCKHDYTCTDNWSLNFRWRNGTNHCPEGAPCYTIKEVYGNAKNFCERVWDHSWEYTEDEKPCMQMWFQPGGGNPNAEVARMRAAEIVPVTAGALMTSSALVTSLVTLLLLLL